MSKNKKSGSKKKMLLNIQLATAILELITAAILFIKVIVN